ncbi:MAG: tetratricopeptide repeat protein [Candidatus Omnitrophica bacterium]|nr:tetratricopeptide repeat protein [Candidatus Omnitrophota bacterium]
MLIGIVTLIVYFNSLFNMFVMDDFSVIVQNDFVKTWKNFPAIFTKAYMTSPLQLAYLEIFNIGSGEITYRPLVTASYFLDYAIWKLNPFGYHLTNIFLHVLNVMLIYFFISLIAKNKKIALLASLLFAVHPVNVEAVNCISFREDLLTFLFFILSFIFYIKLDCCNGIKRFYCYLGSIIFYLFALFSKEMAITLPFLLILYDYFFVSKDKTKNIFYSLKTRYAGYILATLLYLCIWVLFKRYVNTSLIDFSYQGGNFYTNILTMLRVITIYIGWLFVPINIHHALPDPQLIVRSVLSLESIFSLAILMTIFFIAIKIHNRLKEISFGIFWFFIALLPICNIIPIANIIASRYLYIPAVGYCFILAIILSKLTQVNFSFISRDTVRRVTIEIVILLLLFYSMVTVIKSVAWKNNLALWQELVERYPKNSDAHRSLGNFFRESGILDKAINEYKIALRLNSHIAANYNGLGICYYYKGDINKAIKIFKKALILSPNLLTEVYNNLGSMLAYKGLHKEAVFYYKQAIMVDSKYILSYKNLGSAYAKMKDWDEARKILQKGLLINPEDKDIKTKLEQLTLIAQH